MSAGEVLVRIEDTVIPTYLPAAPDRNPMFLEKRVYQGSSGRVYPLPFTDRVAEKPIPRRWKTVWIENEFLRVMCLPEIGGRIHALQDKTNGYDLIYHQPVIKPALVGLAGPWISGGIEFNWPQHHRPATFLPVDFEVEARPDGSKIIWCSDHDPMCRMKGMHGICLHPGRACLELKARVYNRTAWTQTFLWWANVATRVHEGYQSFFPPDVYYVADHARRSMSAYPLCRGRYYGVDYAGRARHGIPEEERPRQFAPPQAAAQADSRPGKSKLPRYRPDDLSFYANIPVPTSYMGMGSRENFFGGYDHVAEAGIVHYANHHISPGKKQWTWGNHEFGYAWDRNLTDRDERGEFPPYIEIMAGVYTDNQPDFSFLQPGETKSWSQYWYPIRKIGPAQHANLEAAVSATITDGSLRLGVAVTRPQPRCHMAVEIKGKTAARFQHDLSPGRPLIESLALPRGASEADIVIRVASEDGGELISCAPKPRTRQEPPPPAMEPPAPGEMGTSDELYLTGVHLEQYRHATRLPEDYWQEALRRDPRDARCNNALGRWRLRRGEFALAETHFRRAIERLTGRNANPPDGEPFYNLGCCLTLQERTDEAYDAFYKATWNQAWSGASYHALAELDCRQREWRVALDHLERALRLDADNIRARNLKALALRQLGDNRAADACVGETLALDPMDWWARRLAGQELQCDWQTRLDLAHDYARAGFLAEAIAILRDSPEPAPARDLPDQSWGAQPMVSYTLGWLWRRMGEEREMRAAFAEASKLAPDYCFPARLEEIGILQAAIETVPTDSRAPYYLGNLLYDRRRHEEAIRLWEKSARLDPSFSVVWRNLGIGYFNVRKNPARARAAYERAVKANPGDARLLYERDQLWKRLGEKPERRLAELERRSELVRQRDDLAVEVCALYNQTGQAEKAAECLASRRFQPWEGGEGGPLLQHTRAQLALGRAALAGNEAAAARAHFECALSAPENLGEARHLLANNSDIRYWLGCACDALGEKASARQHWRAAASFKGDFQEMRVRAFSEMTFYSAAVLEKLGRKKAAQRLLRELLRYAQKLEKSPGRVDYFATSLPTMLLFDDDLDFRQMTTALFLQAQARLGLGEKKRGRALLQLVLRRDPNHALAADFLSEEQT